jgi:hypothetical protein
MSVFHGDRYNEVPKDFINWFLQCMGAANDDSMAQGFINYLEAYSVADEWFEELPEAEKRN